MTVDEKFDMLEYWLKHKPLPTEDGGTRTAGVDEFMYMHTSDDGCLGFKHRFSRNYVFLIPPDPSEKYRGVIHWHFHVPQRNEPFMCGTFDVPAEIY